MGLKAAQILIDGGVDRAKIVICHIDIGFHMDYLEALPGFFAFKMLSLGHNG